MKIDLDVSPRIEGHTTELEEEKKKKKPQLKISYYCKMTLLDGLLVQPLPNEKSHQIKLSELVT